MRLIKWTAALAAAFALPAFADDCRAIASATVAEIQAGEQHWDERTEALVRRAAGAACVKATTIEPAENSAERTASEPGNDSANAPDTSSNNVSEDIPENAANEEQPEDGKAGWKFLGFDVNEAEGSPGQKPYSRKR